MQQVSRDNVRTVKTSDYLVCQTALSQARTSLHLHSRTEHPVPTCVAEAASAKTTSRNSFIVSPTDDVGRILTSAATKVIQHVDCVARGRPLPN
jgi:hypothetical protein